MALHDSQITAPKFLCLQTETEGFNSRWILCYYSVQMCVFVSLIVFTHKLPDNSSAVQKHFFTSCLLILSVKVQTTDMKAFQMICVMHLLEILQTLQILIIQEINRESAN